MDPRERSDDFDEVLRMANERHTSRLWTSLPAIVVEDSADGHTVKVKSAVKVQSRDPSGKVTNVEIPEMGMVPIHFPSAGGLAHTFPVKQGDEGIVIFSARNLDGWWQNGGVQPMPDGYARRHSLSDAMFIPGIRSTPRKLQNVSTTASQIRTEDGTAYVEVASDGSALRLVIDGGNAIFELTKDHVVNITARNGVNIQTNNLAVSGEVTALAGSGNVALSTHTHKAVQTGTGTSGPPVTSSGSAG